MIALDARIKVEDPAIHPPVPCAIRPYPTQWEKTYKLADGSEVFVRPIRPEDERFYAEFMHADGPGGYPSAHVHARSGVFASVSGAHDAGRLRAGDGFHCASPGRTWRPGIAWVARFFADPDYEKGEYAVLIRSDLKGLRAWMAAHAASHQLCEERGAEVALRNRPSRKYGMFQMCRELGFSTERDPDDGAVYLVTLDLSLRRPKVDPVALAGCPKRRKFRLHPSTGSG